MQKTSMKRQMFQGKTEPDTSDARERMILENMRLVYRVAGRFAKSIGSGSREGLISAGTIGLIKAVDNFNAKLSNSFTGYAVCMIVGEIKHYFRDRGWPAKISRQLREVITGINQIAGQKLAQEGKYPTVDELSEELQLPEEVIIEGLEAKNVYAPVSFNEAYEQSERLKNISTHEIEDRIEINKALVQLPHIQQMIIVLRFFEGNTQQQIAAKINISQMHVSRLLKKSLGVMAAYLADSNEYEKDGKFKYCR